MGCAGQRTFQKGKGDGLASAVKPPWFWPWPVTACSDSTGTCPLAKLLRAVNLQEEPFPLNWALTPSPIRQDTDLLGGSNHPVGGARAAQPVSSPPRGPCEAQPPPPTRWGSLLTQV